MIEEVKFIFDPLVSSSFLIGLTIAGFSAWGVYVALSGRAKYTRFGLLVLLVLTLLNPAIIREQGEPLPSVVAVVLDQSESMAFADREAQAREVFEHYRKIIEEHPNFELRKSETNPNTDGTYLFGSVETALSEVSRDRIAGTILITDGQVHDIPTDNKRINEFGPIHVAIVGTDTPYDRRVEIIEVADFGIVGETAEFIIKVEDPNVDFVNVRISVNGGIPEITSVPTNIDTSVSIQTAVRGDNIVLMEVPAGTQELTLANNRVAHTMSGIRDRLKVLLVTGFPNAAGRVWRDLLKSDPSVDLVHFTILKTQNKQDFTPNSELALIPFPTQQLFEEKLNDFDLIIFDQFQTNALVTMQYLANVANYVEEGGALLVIAGENFVGMESVAASALASVLPVSPNGQVLRQESIPQLTETGAKHAITQGYTNRKWGKWMRFVGGEAKAGDVLMSGPNQFPLLVVNRVEKGRIGQLMSDQIWLWYRGYDGGGPFSEMIRRLVHWLMKEPELEERRLDLLADGNRILVKLHTIAEVPPELEIETPLGTKFEPDWQELETGVFQASIVSSGIGLYRARAGNLEGMILSGFANPKEYKDLRSTANLIEPISRATKGRTFRVSDTPQQLPKIKKVNRLSRNPSSNELELRDRRAYSVISSRTYSLLPAVLAVLILTILFFTVWYREGR